MVVIRVIFLIYNFDLTAQLTAHEIFLMMFHGLLMDFSITGYFLVLYGLFLTFSSWFPSGKWKSVAVGFTVFLLLVSGLIVVVDLELYRHWGFRLNSTPFNYLGSGSFGSISPSVLIKGSIVFALIFACFKFVFDRRVKGSFNSMSENTPWWVGLVMIGLTICLFLPIRGSVSVAPMNVGFVYFSRSKPYANHGAINVLWNFLSSLRKSSNIKYPEDFFESGKTQAVMQTLYGDTLRSDRYLKVSAPNVLLIILEGFTSDIIAPLGGLSGITPNLNALAEEGVLFPHIYASGDRTDKGLVSVLSGYPAQTKSSIVKFPKKTEGLPSLTRVLEKQGYQTSFMYGGDADFANFRSYLTNIGFENVTEMDDFSSEQNTSKWGVHDQYLFERLARDIASDKKPFFKTVLTLSSHEPFDVPMKEYAGGANEEQMYLNSCRYTDYCLGTFIEEAKQQPWWDSTLVVITADHGHRHPGNKSLHEERRFRIPLLFLGGALDERGARQVSVIGSQTDIANTVLGQVLKPDSTFRYSRDLLSPGAGSFASFFFQNGYGFVQPGKLLVFDHEGGDFVVKKGEITDVDIERSKAFQQSVFTDFNRR